MKKGPGVGTFVCHGQSERAHGHARFGSRGGRHALLALGLLAFAASPAAAAYYVDNTSASCSPSGPGTEAQPYCTISAAVAAHSGPGVEIVVKPGTYRETVTIPASGSAAGNYVVRAYAPGVVVTGADDFSGPGKWVLSTGTVYVASGVTWGPFQVFVDGVRLIPAAAGTAPASLALNNFLYVSGQGLYVNLGGSDPGTHATEVGHRLYAFRLSAKSYVTIQGFHATRTEDRAIYLSSNSNNCVVRGNTADFAYRYGIAVSTGLNELIEQNIVGDNQDHGIALTSSSSGCTIQDNESYRNVYPTARAANGIYLNSCTANLIQRNRLHNNQDTGLHLQTNANNNISIQNVSYNNGDHGFDHLFSQNTIDIGNVAYGNYKDGFSIEGTSPGTHLNDCIAINNGLYVLPADGVLEYDLWVDSASSVGFVSDYNIFWNSTSQYPVKFISTKYSTVAAYSAASGQDAHSLQVDPKFVDPVNANFHLQAGSPAIDNGISSVPSWPATDADGLARVDDPATTNSGSGTPNYADRGAFEFQASGAVPTAALTVTPSSGTAPLLVTADGSGSTDSDGTIVSYRFDFGDGTVVGPQPGSSATHTYAAGSYTVSLQVTDNLGYQNTTTKPVTATPANQPPNGAIDTPATNVTIYAGQAVNFTSTGLDPDNNVPLSYAWNMGGGAANSSVEDPGPVLFNTAGTYTISLTVTDGLGAADPTPATRIVTVNPAPTGTAADEIHWTFMGPTAVSFDWRGFDNTIRYGATPAYGNTVTAVTPSPIPFSSPGPFWEARLTGLQQNAVYHYSIGGGPDHTFRTPPLPGTAGFTVYAEGDIGDGSHYPNVLTLQNAIAADPTAFNLLVGDLTYGNTNGQAAVDTHFNNMMVWSQDVAYMPAWGNHEYESPTLDDLRNYKGRFDLPNQRTSPNSPTPGGEDWYWFDYGNVRFIAYPEPWSGAWADWGTQAGPLMDQAQANPNIRYIVTIGHQPAYSSGYHVGETTLKNIMDALGDTHSKYVLNINGHSHDYERSYPQHGVTHITAGTGGSDLEGVGGPCEWAGGCPPPSWSAYRVMHHVRFKLTFMPTGIRGEAICGPTDPANDMSCTPGTVIDSFDIDTPFHPPVVSAPAFVSVAEGAPLTVSVTASDADGDAITSLTTTALPAGATFTAGAGNTSGTLSWTPGYDQAGSYTVTFTASNALSGYASTTITVGNVDRAPAVTTPSAVSVNEGAPLTVNLTAADPDGDALTGLVASGLPSGATFTPGPGNTSGALSWTPSFSQAGSYTVTFTASNALSGSATTTITVTNVDVPPVVTATATASGPENALLTVNVTAADPDGDAIASLVAAGLPAGASFTPGAGNTSGTLSWTPTFSQAGSYTVTFTASNALSGSSSTAITVTNVDRAPVVTATATASGPENAPLTVGVTAADPDGEAIGSLVATGLPAGASFAPGAGNTSGTLSWTPDFSQAGSYTVTFTASNALAGSASMAITISNVDRAPSVTAPVTASGTENALLTLNVTAADLDGDAIGSLVATGLPAGASFTPGAGNTSGTLSWTPGFDQAGSYTVTFTASNALSGSASTTITVGDTARPPEVTAPSTASVAENAPLTVNVTAADPDGDPIGSLVATGLPAGASFTPGAGNTSGTLSWTPSFTAAGSYTVTFTASNALSGSATTVITVTNTDRAPVVTATATASGPENALLTVDVTAADPDGEAITSLVATGLPAGASFTPGAGNTSGTLSWTPGFDQSGSYTVTFTASNALAGSASTQIAISNVDRAPAVTTPATASGTENAPLTVNVTAADPDGEAIGSLVATGLPAGASFTPGAGNTSGTLSWTPGFDQSGSYTVTFTASNALSGSATTAITVTKLDRAPAVTATPTASVAENAPLTIDVTAADADGEAISSLTATGLPSGASFTPGAGNTSGQLSWTPSFSQAGSYTVTFTASNALSGSATTTITVTNVDRAPVVTAPSTVDGAEGTPLTVDVTASDPDADAITSLTATGLPSGATFTAGAGNLTGALHWTPSYSQAGSYTVTFTASNALSGSSSTVVTVINVNGPPEVTAPATASVAENAPLTVDVTVTDPDGDEISSLVATGLPAGATFTPGAGNTSGTLSWTPSFTEAGSYTVTFTASNAQSGSATTVITVTNTDRAPVVTATATASAPENALLTVDVTASDVDGDAIASLSATGLPAGASFTPGAGNTSGQLSWTPTFSQAGSYTVTFTASNALSGSSSTEVTISNVDRAPTVTAPATASGAENAPLTVNVTASDLDGDAIGSLTATGLPSGAIFTPGAGNTSGTLSWTPGFDQSGSYIVTFTASNALSGSATTTITVTKLDRAPVVTATATASGPENAAFTIDVSAADPDGDAIGSLTATGLPAGASFTPGAGNTGGTLQWTPTFEQAGSYTVTFTASNALSGSATTTITVTNVDRAPVVTATATASGPEGAPLTVNVTAADPDGEAIGSLSATGLPAGASFTPGAGNTSGALSWTPTFAQAGSYTVTFTASNALSGSSSTAITITNVDRAPAVTAPGTATGAENALLTVGVTAADADGEAIASLTAAGLPAGASFTPDPGNASGTLSWTPTFAQAGSYTVTFTASNALSGSATTTITIGNSDRAPQVTATATASVAENAALTINVTAADPDGEAIGSLSATGLPAGASFTPGAGNTSGTLSWTPTFAQAGSYTVTFTATNALSGSSSTAITVTNVDRAPVVTAPANANGVVGGLLTVNVTAADPDGDPITTLSAAGLPSGATFTPGAGNTSGTLSWTPPSGSQGSYSVTFTASNALSGSATTLLTIGSAQPPVAALAVTPLTGNEPLTVTADASASSDPDGSIVSYAFVFGDNNATGPIPTATASHTYFAGTYTLTLTVTDNSGLTNSKSVTIVVAQKIAGVNLATNPSFEADTTKWQAYGNATLQRVSGGFDGFWSCAITATGTGSFGINDHPDFMHVTPAAGTPLRYRAWVRSNGSGGTAKIQMREYSGTTPVAAQVRSTGVVLSPNWQLLTLDYTCVAAGTTIDFQVVDFPLAAGESFQVDNVSVYNLSSTVGVGDVPVAMEPMKPLLAPSPLRSSSSLTFLTTRVGRLQVGLYDLTGRRVRQLMNDSQASAGVHRLQIDGKSERGEALPSGMYFYRIEAAEGAVSGRLVIAR